MSNINISIEEAGKISNLLIELEGLLSGKIQIQKDKPPGEMEKDISKLRALLYKKIIQAQKKSSRRKSEASELLALLNKNSERLARGDIDDP